MIKNNYNVIGIMSGTSLDGIDLAYVNFKLAGSWSYEILKAETIGYSEQWKQELSAAVSYDDLRLKELNELYTEHLATVISEFILRNNISEVDAICSHGHTVKHEPENGFTLQIGNLPGLALRLDQLVVCDFRIQDVQLGGQGAPLVPIGDELLFSEYEYCLNLGGFANISTRKNGRRSAYDICAVNTVLNWLSNQLDLEYDKGGKIASSGALIPELLEELEGLSFYNQPPPKSLGIEWVHREIFPLMQNYSEVSSLMHTYVVHIAREIGRSLKYGNDLVTGGGAFNSFLIAEIRKNTTAKIIIPESETINFKEALIFAFLGVLKIRGEINVLSAVTGASRDHSSGVVYAGNATKA